MGISQLHLFLFGDDLAKSLKEARQVGNEGKNFQPKKREAFLESAKKRLWSEESCQRRCEESKEVQEILEKECQPSIEVSKLKIKHNLQENTEFDKHFYNFIQDAKEL